MADIKKYLDQAGAQQLVTEVKAADAKVLESANAHADSLAKNYDAAGAATTAEVNAKKYTDEVAATLEKAGEAAKVQTNLDTEVQARKDGDAALQSSIDAVDAKADKNAEDIVAINNEETGILAQAKADATTKANAVQAKVDALDEKVGDLPEGATATDIVGYIQERTSGIATESDLSELQAGLSQAQKDIDAIEADYLKVADKTELQGNIDSESAARASADDALSARIKAVEDDYLKTEDKTELTQAIATAKQEAIETVLGEGQISENFDTLKEVADWIQSDTTGAAALQTKVSTLEGEMDAVQADMTQAQKDIDAVEAAVATKAEQSALAQEIADRKSGDTALDDRLKLVEAQLGDGENSVSDLIADAKQEAITAATEAAATDATTKADKALADAKKYADEEDAKIESRVDALETASATHATKAEVEAVAGRVTTLETDMTQAKSDIDAVEEKAAANETAIGTINTELAKKAAQTDLDAAVARISANETAIAKKAEDTDLDAALERVTANEEAIATNTASIAANASAIAAFSPIPTSDITAMFA